MTATCSRRRRRKYRVAWFRRLAGELLNVCLSDRRRCRGSDMAGYHTVRILRAKVDRKTGQVVQVVIRMFGGRSDTNGGFNGPMFVLDDRKEFVGGICRGVIHGRDTVPIDQHYAWLRKRRVSA